MAGRRGVFSWLFCFTTWKTRHENPAIDWEVGEGGRYACGLAHFHNGYSFLTISPNLHVIWLSVIFKNSLRGTVAQGIENIIENLHTKNMGVRRFLNCGCCFLLHSRE
jgi:hypothetical protein